MGFLDKQFAAAAKLDQLEFTEKLLKDNYEFLQPHRIRNIVYRMLKNF